MVMHTCPHCGDKQDRTWCPKCGAVLDKAGVCPALCKPPASPPPPYTGPAVIGLTHIGRMARGHE